MISLIVSPAQFVVSEQIAAVKKDLYAGIKGQGVYGAVYQGIIVISPVDQLLGQDVRSDAGLLQRHISFFAQSVQTRHIHADEIIGKILV